jgi:hypothetical protein
MKSITKILGGLAILAISVLTSCGKDDPVTCNWTTELQNESDALVAAATAYGNNPTTANCEAYKDAFQDYLNEAEKYVSCATTAGQGAELQSAINQAQADLNALQC